MIQIPRSAGQAVRCTRALRFCSSQWVFFGNRLEAPPLMRGPANARQHLGAIKINGFFLILLTGMDVNDRCSAVEQPLNRIHMLSRFASDRPLGNYIVQGNLALGAALNLRWIMDVVQSLESFRQ